MKKYPSENAIFKKLPGKGQEYKILQRKWANAFSKMKEGYFFLYQMAFYTAI